MERQVQGFQFESKADALTRGCTSPDWRLREAAARELDSLCERKPVEDYVISQFLRLLEDDVMTVRRTAIERLPRLCAVGNKACVRAVLDRMWADESWAVRLQAVHAVQLIAEESDPQALMGLVGRITDPEAKRGGRFTIREAALQAVVSMAGRENALQLRLVIERLHGQGWAEVAQAVQAMLLQSQCIPCRLDDPRHPQAPGNQGFSFHPQPVHSDKVMLSAGGAGESGQISGHKFIGQRYEIGTPQSEILPRVMQQLWIPPKPGGGAAKEDRTHEWGMAYRFAVLGSGCAPNACAPCRL